MTSQKNADLEHVVSSIEQKLQTLEERRQELRHQIEVKRAQVRELTNTLKRVRQLEQQLGDE